MAVRRAWLIPLFAILFCVASYPQENPNQAVSVDEAKIEFHLFPETHVDIPLLNHADHAIRGTLLLEMLGDEENNIVARNEGDFESPPGANTVTLHWDRKNLPYIKSLDIICSYRLRYTLTPGRSGGFQPVQGIIQMGPHIVDGFGLQSFPSGEFQCALDCRFLVRVLEPNSGRGLMGYAVKANFGPDPGTLITATTDTDGYAKIHYDVPAGPAHADLGMQIRILREPFGAGSGGMIFWRVPPHMFVTTDKRSYRPGETVHIEVALTGIDRKPWAGAHASLKIVNVNGGAEILRTKLPPLELGKGSMYWTVPENLEPGTLSILATSEDEPQGNWTAKSKAKIEIEQRQQLKFNLSVVPDRKYYLPGQNAKLTVSATDLSGRPIRDAIVQAKWWRRAEVESRGVPDGSGRFIAPIELKKTWDSFEGMPTWMRPSSYKFPVEVVFTETSTGNTESRKVMLPMVSQEIHLYMVEYVRVGTERTLGIVSPYVNGSAASVNGFVEATAPDAQGQCPETPGEAHMIRRGIFHTNSYGVARFDIPHSWIGLAYPKHEEGAQGTDSAVQRLISRQHPSADFTCILLTASDAKGTTATLYQEAIIENEARFGTRFSTDHVLYHPGDPVDVTVESDGGLTEAVVEIRTPDLQLAGVQHVRLINGRAGVTFPYGPLFHGLLTVHVYAATAVDDPAPADSWTREVIYPTGEGLKAGERWPGDMWKPDEIMWDNSRMGDGVSRSVRVADRDEPYRGRIAGIERGDLLGLDPAKPFPEGMELVAWALLEPMRAWGGWPGGCSGFSPEKLDKENLAPIAPAVEKHHSTTGQNPKTEAELIEQLKEAGIDLRSLRDGWGMPYRVVFGRSTVYLVSNGLDKIPNTRDDYVAGEIHLP